MPAIETDEPSAILPEPEETISRLHHLFHQIEGQSLLIRKTSANVVVQRLFWINRLCQYHRDQQQQSCE
jgi:hypothetical protein